MMEPERSGQPRPGLAGDGGIPREYGGLTDDGVGSLGETAGLDPVVASPGGSPGEATWRDEATTASGLNVLAGIWLIVSPFVLVFGPGYARWNPIVFGAIVLVLALVRLFVPTMRTAWLSGVNAAIGVWLFVSAFWLADSGGARWDEWIMGVVVFILAVWSISSSPGSRIFRR